MEVLVNPFPLTEIIGIVVCLICSAFFSGTETALTHLSETRCRHLIESSPEKYGLLQFWLTAKKRILAGLLVGNNLVNILCSILAYRVALRFVPNYAEAVSVFALTLIVLVFAEITPKSLALYYSEQLAVTMLRIIWLVDKLLWVVAAPLARFPELFIRKSDIFDQEPPVTEGEIEFQIRLGHDRAVFEEEAQGDLLMSAVEFSETTVKEVLVPRTEMFGLDVMTPVEEAVDATIDQGHSRIPVYQDDLDHIIGILHAKDLLLHIWKHGNDDSLNIEKIVRRPPLFSPETQKIRELLAKMRSRRTHLAIVVDEFGGTSGIVTLEDIIEELVGEIRDEFDYEESPVRQVDSATWIVDAKLSISDLRDATGVALKESKDYESVGGFVVAEYGNIPRTGTIISIPGLKLRILASDARHVEHVEVTQVPLEEQEENE
jgi:CBS domain containing-hemolysin-like protein